MVLDKPKLDFGSLLGSPDMLRLDLKKEMEILRTESKRVPTVIEEEEGKHEHLAVVTTEERNKKH